MNASVTDPGSLRILERRIGAYADSTQQQAGRIRVTIGQVVVAQLLPGALVKGGSGMRLRLGLDFARDSKDLDVAWRDAQHVFDEFGATLDGSADTLLPDEIADMFVWGRQTPALRIGRGIDSLPGRVRPHGGSQVQPTSMATRSSGLG